MKKELADYLNKEAELLKLKMRVKRELSNIKKDYKVKDWEFHDVDKCSPEEAYTRGFYRAYDYVLSVLNKIN